MMNPETSEAGISECERLEFNRRKDEAFAVCHAALRLFSIERELKATVEEDQRPRRNYWYWGIGVFGLILDFILRERPTGFDPNFGTFIWGATALTWFAKSYETSKVQKRLSELLEELYRLEMHWAAATRDSTYWNLRYFLDDNGIKNDEGYESWWRDVRFRILVSVTDWDRALQIQKSELGVRLGVRELATEES